MAIRVDVDRNAGLGAMLKVLRKRHGMTQAQVADAMGVVRTSVTNIEAGRQLLSVETINAYAAAIGYEVRVRFVRVAQEADPPEQSLGSARP